MSELGYILENLYSQFVLRDLFAKIAPGSMVILSSSLMFSSSLGELRCDISKFSFWLWLIVLASAWIVGMVIQHGGIIVCLIKDQTYCLRRKKKWSKTEEKKKFYEDKIKERFLKKAKITTEAGAEFNRVLERIVVIKEACGNWSVALSYSALTILVHPNHGYWPHRDWPRAVILLAIGAIVLNLAHRFHFDREGWFKDTYHDLNKEKPDHQ